MQSEAKLLIFGGTTEAREILEHNIPALCCVTTEYGANLLKNLKNIEILTGRLDEQKMINLMKSRNFLGVIDATHSYAVEVSKNIKSACEKMNLPLIHINRQKTKIPEDCKITRVNSFYEAAEILNSKSGNIFFTTGSKEIEKFKNIKDFSERVYIRVLPVPEILIKCENSGIKSNHVIAMQGPFSYDLNLAMFKSSNASIIVTKDSGEQGGLNEKLLAARDLNLEIILISRQNDIYNNNDSEGMTVSGAILWARKILKLSRKPFFPLMIDIEMKKVLIIGGGKIASRRAETLLKCGAEIFAVSLNFCDEFPVDAKKFSREFLIDDLNKKDFIIIASDNRKLNHEIWLEAKKRNIPVNVADCPGECDFFFPSLINSGYAAASVCTAGMSKSLTKKLSDRLRNVWPLWVNQESKN